MIIRIHRLLAIVALAGVAATDRAFLEIGEDWHVLGKGFCQPGYAIDSHAVNPHIPM